MLFNEFFNEYPYRDISSTNLDWLVKQLRKLEKELINFVSLNTITYADPIQWSITRQYKMNTVVVEPISKTAYISTKPVPIGVRISDTNYWTPIFDLNQLSSNRNITLREDGFNVLASFPSHVGDWLIWQDLLYKVVVEIPTDTPYLVGYNIERYTVEMFVKDCVDDLTSLINGLSAKVGNLNMLETTEKSTIVGAINELVGAIADVYTALANTETAINGKIGVLTDLTTTAKNNLVAAINEVVTKIDDEASARTTADTTLQNQIGNLTNLTTTNKTNLVNAINSIISGMPEVGYVTPQDYGAVGDGTTNDTSAVQNALNSGLPVKFVTDYAVTTVNYTGTENYIDFNGHELIGIGTNNDFVLTIYEAMYNIFNAVKISIAPSSRDKYYGCIRIHSSSNRQSQFNVFNGMFLLQCWHGVVWGAKDGESSVSNAQSETFINNFRTRSVPIPFLGNQDNGYLTFVGGVFDVNQYEQWTDSRINYDNNRCVVNQVGKVNFIGCEFAATVNVNHIGFVGGDIHAYDSIIEICGTQAFITGDFSLINWYNGYIGQVTKTPFIVNNGAKGVINISNGTFHHGGAVASNNLFYGYDAPEMRVYLNNVTFADTPYSLDMFGNLNVKCNNFVLSAVNITLNDDDITGLSLIDNNSTDVTAFGEAISCVASFDSVIGRRGVAVQFNGEAIGSYYSEMIPIYGGTLYHANCCGLTDGNNVYVYLEFYDSTNSFIGVDLLQTINGVRLNRCRLAYAPTGAKYCRLRITNDSTRQVYCITCDVALYWKRRG